MHLVENKKYFKTRELRFQLEGETKQNELAEYQKTSKLEFRKNRNG